MEQFSTEEQQVEAIKKFWKENGTAIILGAVLGLGGLWGWRYFNDTQVAASEAASDAYQQSVEQLATNQELSRNFIEQHKDSNYAVLAALQLAKQAVEDKNLEEAAKQLNWVKANSEKDSIKAVASLRLARVQLEQQAYQQALDSLNAVSAEAFSAQVAEIKGDVYQRQGDLDKARAAYSQALEKNAANGLLKMKLDNLAAEVKA